MLNLIVQRLSWESSTILLIMDLQHFVIAQVFGMFVPIKHKWLLTIPCVQQNNFTRVGNSKLQIVSLKLI